MSLWLDDKYMRLVGGQLEQFTLHGGSKYTFRCPLCGDSTKNKYKKRGYVYPLKTFLFFKCHNCGAAHPFGLFLKKISRTLYDAYSLERFEEHASKRPAPPPVERVGPAPQTTATDKLNTLPLSSPLLPTSLEPVRQFILDRQLPVSALSRLYATEHARRWLEPLVGDKKLKGIEDGVPFLVIPLLLPNGAWFGAQLRPIDHKMYHTFRWGHDSIRAFGLDVVDLQKTVYVVEGPLDSLCLPNAIGMCGADLLASLTRLWDDGIQITNRVLIWDNEPRNHEIVKFMHKAAVGGERLVIWPKHYPKDVNDMLAAGLDPWTTIQHRTFSGLSAELELQQWKQ